MNRSYKFNISMLEFYLALRVSNTQGTHKTKEELMHLRTEDLSVSMKKRICVERIPPNIWISHFNQQQRNTIAKRSKKYSQCLLNDVRTKTILHTSISFRAFYS